MPSEKSLVEDLAAYIKKNLKKGYTLESLKWALINQGYSKIQVEKALKKAELDLAAEAPVLKAKPKIEYKVIEPELKSEEAPKEKISFWKKFFCKS